MRLSLKNLSTVYKQIKNHDGLYLPDFNRNIFKLRDTYEDILNVNYTNNSLLNDLEIKKVLSKKDCLDSKNILHFTIDSLGINRLKSKKIFLNEYIENNEIIEISSLFPTITSTIMLSIYSGIPPENHGILGHKIFFPELGAIMDTLRLSIPGAKNDEKDSLIKAGINAKSLLWEYRPHSLYESEEYKQYNFLASDIAMSGLSHLMLESHSVVSFRNLVDGFEKLKILLKRNEKMYIHFYIGDIDDISHIYGPDSEGCENTLDVLNYIFKKFLKSFEKDIAKNTILAITADHGQNQLLEENKIFFKKEEIESYSKFLKTNMGKSGRVLHFYVKDDKIDEFKEIISEKLGESALILTKFDDLTPLFSSKTNYNRLFERLGNLIIIFKPSYSSEKEYENEKEEPIEFKMKGTHGSLSQDELLIPWIIDKLETFQKFL